MEVIYPLNWPVAASVLHDPDTGIWENTMIMEFLDYILLCFLC